MRSLGLIPLVATARLEYREPEGPPQFLVLLEGGQNVYRPQARRFVPAYPVALQIAGNPRGLTTVWGDSGQFPQYRGTLSQVSAGMGRATLTTSHCTAAWQRLTARTIAELDGIHAGHWPDLITRGKTGNRPPMNGLRLEARMDFERRCSSHSHGTMKNYVARGGIEAHRLRTDSDCTLGFPHATCRRTPEKLSSPSQGHFRRITKIAKSICLLASELSQAAQV